MLAAVAVAAVLAAVAGVFVAAVAGVPAAVVLAAVLAVALAAAGDVPVVVLRVVGAVVARRVPWSPVGAAVPAAEWVCWWAAVVLAACAVGEGEAAVGRDGHCGWAWHAVGVLHGLHGLLGPGVLHGRRGSLRPLLCRYLGESGPRGRG